MREKAQNGNSCSPWPDHPLFAREAPGAYDAGPPKKGLRTVSVRRPGQKGTLEALREYGERLVCVRYLKDSLRGKRYKTVEIIVHEEDWTPSPTERSKLAPLDPERIVTLRLPMADEALRGKVWAAGGRWDSRAKVWRMPYRAVRELKLDAHIVKTEGDTP